MKVKLILACVAMLFLGNPVFAADKPNIVLVFMDNFGWGEIGAYGGGILRGAPTPRIDSLADEGLKLLNFNVESQCVPSRSAILTGRYAIRSGTSKVPLKAGVYGMTQWEYTMAEMLSDAGYATGMFGKWHLGDSPGRYPTDQGFDEWYGIPNTTDESFWPDNDLFCIRFCQTGSRRSRVHGPCGRFHQPESEGQETVLPLRTLHANPYARDSRPGFRRLHAQWQLC
jgi:arylsulfatase